MGSETYGQALLRLRLAAKTGRRKLATALGIAPGTLGRIEQGERPPFGLRRTQQALDVLGVMDQTARVALYRLQIDGRGSVELPRDPHGHVALSEREWIIVEQLLKLTIGGARTPQPTPATAPKPQTEPPVKQLTYDQAAGMDQTRKRQG